MILAKHWNDDSCRAFRAIDDRGCALPEEKWPGQHLVFGAEHYEVEVAVVRDVDDGGGRITARDDANVQRMSAVVGQRPELRTNVRLERCMLGCGDGAGVVRLRQRDGAERDAGFVDDMKERDLRAHGARI